MDKQKDLADALEKPSYFPKRVQLSKYAGRTATLYSLPYKKASRSLLPEDVLKPANDNDY